MELRTVDMIDSGKDRFVNNELRYSFT